MLTGSHPQISATASNFGPSTVWPALEVSKMLRWVLKANFRKRVTHDNAHMIIILIAFIFHWHHNYNFAHSHNLKWNYTHNFKCNYTYNWRLAVGLHRGLLLHQPRHSNCWSNSWSGAQLWLWVAAQFLEGGLGERNRRTSPKKPLTCASIKFTKVFLSQTSYTRSLCLSRKVLQRQHTPAWQWQAWEWQWSVGCTLGW